MKKENHNKKDGMRSEYDFSSMKNGIRGKYVKRLRTSTNVVLLETEVAEAFPTEKAVNQALRGVLNNARAIRRSGGLGEKTLKSSLRTKIAAKRSRSTL